MKRLILAAACSTVLAIAAVAAHSTTARAATPATATTPTTTAADAAPQGWRKGRGERLAALRNSPAFQTVRNLHELERLYLIDGRAQEIPAMYRDVLTRTENPAVRQFAYHRIARYDMKPADVTKSIATLRQSLDESLQRLPQ